MKRAAIVLAVLLLPSLPLRAAGVDPSRLPASGWAGNVGIPGGIPPDYPDFCDVRRGIPGTALRAAGDGKADDSPAIQYAVDHCPDRMAVHLPAGTYRLDRPIVRRGRTRYDGAQHPFSILIRGDGPALTRLVFRGPGTVLSLLPAGAENAQTMAIVGGDARGSTELRLSSVSPYLVPGIYAVVHRRNAEATFGHDPRYMADAASQMVEVTAVHRLSGRIDFRPALNEAYASDFLTVGLSPPYRCGVADLAIVDRSDSRGHNLRIVYGQECWISNVESALASKWHFRLESCARCEVRRCYVHDGWGGGGDTIYGVGLFAFSCNNLVEDNIAVHCRHSFVTEYGGQGNVFAYNYSRDPINERQLGTDYLMGDLVHHGGEARWNLWEGNVACDVKFDSVLGGSACDTVLRNRITRKGLPATVVANFGTDIQRGNCYENLVGNVYEPPPPGTSWPLRRWGTNQDDASHPDPQPQATAWLDGECDLAAGRVRWDPRDRDHRLPASYYLPAKPSWFGPLAWPPVDPERALSGEVGAIPAEGRAGALPAATVAD